MKTNYYTGRKKMIQKFEVGMSNKQRKIDNDGQLALFVPRNAVMPLKRTRKHKTSHVKKPRLDLSLGWCSLEAIKSSSTVKFGSFVWFLKLFRFFLHALFDF